MDTGLRAIRIHRYAQHGRGHEEVVRAEVQMKHEMESLLMLLGYFTCEHVCH